MSFTAFKITHPQPPTENHPIEELIKSSPNSPPYSVTTTTASPIGIGSPPLSPSSDRRPLSPASAPSTPFITPEIARKHPSRIPQISTPRKGILKHSDRAKSIDPDLTGSPTLSGIRPTVSYTTGDPFFRIPPPPPPPPSFQRPAVGFTGRDVVAIIGDTSDEYESDARNSIAIPPPMSPIPETTLVEPPPKMFDERIRSSPGLLNGAFLMEDSDSVAEERSQDDSKITEGRSDDFASTEDDLVSISSSTCSSHIAKWWNGKDTRFVVHCEKKGCKHRHGSPRPESNGSTTGPNGQYLTPTQRFNKEIGALKLEIKKLEREIRQKDGELLELRERIKQIDDGKELAENNKLLRLLEEKSKKFDEDREKLLAQNAANIERLNGEIFDLRTELAAKQSKIEALELSQLIPNAEASTQTIQERASTEDLQPMAASESGSGSMIQTPSDPIPNVSLSATKSVSVQQSPSFQSVPMGNGPIIGDALTEAYRQEAIFFRTKASELELIVRDHILQREQSVSDAVQTLGNPEAEPFDGSLGVADSDPRKSSDILDEAVAERRKRLIKQSMSLMGADSIRMSPFAKSVSPSDCRSPVCAERHRKLNEENEEIMERMEEQIIRCGELEEELEKSKAAYREERKSNEDLRFEFEQLSNLAEERLVECIGSQKAVEKLQTKADQLAKALNYVEERLHAYQRVILDNGLVVRGEEMSEWHRGADDPRFQTFFSKPIQTDLTAAMLSDNESELSVLLMRLQEVQREYHDRQVDLDTQFTEIEANLQLKARLCDQLTRQLDAAAQQNQLVEERRQTEREYYQKKIEEMGAELERLPGLRMEMDRIEQEKSLLQLQISGLKEHYEDGLEEALREAMQKFQKQDEYWAEKVGSVERSRNQLKNSLDRLQMDFEELKMRAQLEKSDLEQRLASSIEHIVLLDQKLNPPRRDAEMMARPKTVNKYVACRPNHRHKAVQVEKPELEPSESDKNVAELVKYKEALLRAVRLVDLPMPETATAPKAAPPRPAPPKIKTETAKKRSVSAISNLFPSLKKNGRTRSNLSFGQVHFDSRDGVTLGHFGRKRKDEEDENDDAASFLSLPAAIGDHGDSDEWSSSRESSTLREEEEEEAEGGKKKESSGENRSVELEVDEEGRQPSTNEGTPDNDFAKLDKLQKEVLRLRSRVAETDDWAAKLLKLEEAIPEEIQMGPQPKSRAQRPTKAQIDRILDKTVEILRSSRLPKLERCGSESDVSRSLYSIRPSVQLNARLKKKSPPRFKPLPIPTKWDNDRAELLRQNAHYAAQLLALKAKMDRIREDEATTVEELSSLDEVERDLRLLINEISPPSEAQKQNIELIGKLRGDRDHLFMESLDLKMRLQDAENELLIYRQEPRDEARRRWENIRLPRSRSAEGLADAANPRELRRWKESAGVSFRELNRLRALYDRSAAESADLRTQVAILRGEIELSRCQTQMANEWAARKRVCRQMSLRSTGSDAPQNKTIRFVAHGSALDLSMTPIRILKDTDETLNRSEPNLTSFDSTEDPIQAADKALLKELQLMKDAFRQQMTNLREKNRELEEKVAELQSQIQTNNDELEAIAEKEAQMNSLNSRIEILRQETEMYENKIREIEEERQEMYYVMFRKGQQAAEHDERRMDEMTEDRIVLKFLHDAFYYYMMNKGDSREHLQAIMTMLNFTSQQKDDIYKRRGKSH